MTITVPVVDDGRTAAARPFLRVEDLRVHFPTDDGLVKSVDGLSFELERGEVLGIVGESGSGKSVTSQAILGLHKDSNARISGEIWLDGRELISATEDEVRRMRGNDMAMIFQDPLSALHPFYTIGSQISEAYLVHNRVSKRQARTRAIDMLGKVAIPNAASRYDDYPHQFSGGMRQRAMIAMALIGEPKLLIADEPTTALDVTVQAQIFDLLREQQRRRGTAIVMITHDMGAVSEMSDRVVVMYGGRVVEEGLTAEILERPGHPYTKGLIACLPELDFAPTDDRADLPEIPGVVPSVWERGLGCPFADRCVSVMPKCRQSFPPSFQTGPAQKVACWLYEEHV